MTLWLLVASLLILNSASALAQVTDPVPVDTVGNKMPVLPQEEPPNPDQPPILACMQATTEGAKEFNVLIADRATKTVARTIQSKGAIAYQPILLIDAFKKTSKTKKNSETLEYSLSRKLRNGDANFHGLVVNVEAGAAAFSNEPEAEEPSLYSDCKVFEAGEYIKLNAWIRSHF